MKIRKVTIKNFGGVQEMTLSPQHLNVLLGHCGTGKTSVLNAIHFALTGNAAADNIRYDSPSASVLLEFCDDSTLERTRTGSGTTVKYNGKKTTAKSLDEIMQNKLGASCAVYEAMCGVDYFEALSQKDMTALFLSILPAKMNFDFLCDKLASHDLDSEKKAYLKARFDSYESVFGLEELDDAYRYFFQKRKEVKALVHSLEAKANFDEKLLPKESKKDLEEQLYRIAKKEAEIAAYHENMAAYEKSLKEHAHAKSRLESLKTSLKSFDSTSKPDVSVLSSATKDKGSFERAIGKAQGFIATAKSNLGLFNRTLESLDKPVCPISEKLACSTDKSGLKNELIQLIAENRKVVKEYQDFMEQCKVQVKKREDIIQAYNQNLVSYTKKESLEKQIQEFVLPEVRKKPEPIPSIDFSAAKKELSQKIQVIAAYELFLMNKAELEEKKKELALAEYAVRVLDVKSGVRSQILAVVMKKFEDLCNDKAEAIQKDFRIKLECDEGIQVSVKTKKDGGFIPIHRASTGEFVIVAYLLMKIINEIMGTKYLIIDSLDKLDAAYTKSFIDLLSKDDGYEHIFIGAVDHDDTKEILKDVNVISL